MLTYTDYLAACAEIVNEGFHYDNSIPGRCDPASHGLDCSTFVALALNRCAPGTVDPCTNSWALQQLCGITPRPVWMTQRFGPGFGTSITETQALLTPGAWWFHSTGDGHIETGLGNGGGSVGAHSHATGIGYGNWFPGFFDDYALPPYLLDSYDPALAWKVKPVYNPPLSVVDFLSNVEGGTWMLLPNGAVLYSRHGHPTLLGGMISTADQLAFQGRTAAKLLPRTYGTPPRSGYTIEATSGETYIPASQH